MEDRTREEYLLEILSITEEQHHYIASGDYIAFGELGEKRQELIDRMEDMQKSSLTLGEKKILEEIIKLDKENEMQLADQMEEVKKELRNLNESVNRDKKYIDPYPNLNSGRYFDYGKR